MSSSGEPLPMRAAASGETVFWVQTFKRTRGRIVPGIREVVLSERAARTRASALGGRLPGAAALRIDRDGAGETSAVTVLALHGTLPDDWAEAIADSEGEPQADPIHPASGR